MYIYMYIYVYIYIYTEANRPIPHRGTNDRITLQPWLSKTVLELDDKNILESATLLSLPQRRQETNNRQTDKRKQTCRKVTSEQWQRNLFNRIKRCAHTNTHQRTRKNNKRRTCETWLSKTALESHEDAHTNTHSHKYAHTCSHAHT